MLCLVNILLALYVGKYLCHNFTTKSDNIYVGIPWYTRGIKDLSILY